MDSRTGRGCEDDTDPHPLSPPAVVFTLLCPLRRHRNRPAVASVRRPGSGRRAVAFVTRSLRRGAFGARARARCTRCASRRVVGASEPSDSLLSLNSCASTVLRFRRGAQPSFARFSAYSPRRVRAAGGHERAVRHVLLLCLHRLHHRRLRCRSPLETNRLCVKVWALSEDGGGGRGRRGGGGEGGCCE